MAARNPKIQIAFRYRTVDSVSGVTRKTVKRLALGVDETQAIHQALRELAAKVLPQYEQDDAPCPPHKCGRSRSAYRKAPGARSDRACSRWNLRR
jgi:hypothetical protein